MSDTTPAAFDPKCRNPQLNTQDFKAGAAILAGQAVSFHGTGVSWTVHPTVAATTTGFVGIAAYSQATVGGKVAVHMVGSICKVCEGKGSAIDAGDYLMECSVAGCVATGTDSADISYLGQALEDIDANGTGYCVIIPQYSAKGA